MNLIVYARVSTTAQAQDGNITLQYDATEKYANENNHTIIRRFADDGVSGAKDLENRPALAEMLDYLESDERNADTVLIYSLDRLARDLGVQEVLIGKFKKLKVSLISIREPGLDEDSPTRILLRQMLGAIAQYERALITMRLSAGRTKKREENGWCGGQVPYGYKVVDKVLRKLPDEQQIIRIATKNYHTLGLTLRQVAEELNRLGYKTKRGGKWHANSVSRIIKVD